nr:type I CRISPR-associated protein Cas7 [Pirellulales bacterium]
VDRSATRGEMAAQALFVFEHESLLGNAPATKLFDLVTALRVDGNDGAYRPARCVRDYDIVIDESNLPAGISVRQRI